MKKVVLKEKPFTSILRTELKVLMTIFPVKKGKKEENVNYSIS
jgi:hypothetical protein